MADRETKEWAEKSRQIEAERLKAAKDLNERTQDKSNLAFLNPTDTKVKGWSSDKNVMMASIERMGNRAIVLAIAGVVLGVIGYVGGIVSDLSNLGAAGAIISGMPSGISFICLVIAVIMAIITIGGEVYNRVKLGQKFSASIWSATGAIVVVTLYLLVRSLVV